MNRGRFFAAFLLLSLITALLLGYSVLFFRSAPVWAQVSAWTRPATATPLAQNIALREKPAPALRPTATPLPTQTPAPAPVREQPPPPPVVQVVEDPAPDGSLIIPALSIDQPVVPVAVRDQVWDLENLGTQIGWLQSTGSHPNDDLAMAFIGHITLPYPGGAGPFLNLNALKIGDVVGYRQGQQTYIYEVKRRDVVKPDQVDYLYVPDGKRLLLVTCTGYNALEWRYDLRLVVEAELIRSEDP